MLQNHQARETGIGCMKQQNETEASEELAKKEGGKLFQLFGLFCFSDAKL